MTRLRLHRRLLQPGTRWCHQSLPSGLWPCQGQQSGDRRAGRQSCLSVGGAWPSSWGRAGRPRPLGGGQRLPRAHWPLAASGSATCRPPGSQRGPRAEQPGLRLRPRGVSPCRGGSSWPIEGSLALQGPWGRLHSRDQAFLRRLRSSGTFHASRSQAMRESPRPASAGDGFIRGPCRPRGLWESQGTSPWQHGEITPGHSPARPTRQPWPLAALSQPCPGGH